MKKIRRSTSILIGILLFVFLLGFFIYLLSPLETKQEMSLHPYVGYVMNPEYQGGINALGFRGELPEKNSPKYTVGIFGGSVAYMYAIAESEHLQAELALKLGKSPNDIEVYSFAIPGFKQPQQLMALTHLYSLGYTFDLVINIDGFNEAVLSYVESHKRGVTTYFPRNWYVLSRTNMRLRSRILAGMLVGIRNTQNSFTQFSWGRDKTITNILENLYYRVTTLLQKSLSSEPLSYQTGGPESISKQKDIVDIEDSIVNTWAQAARQMHRIAKANGAYYIEILHPNQYVQNSKPFSKVELTYYVNPGHPYANPAATIYPKLLQSVDSLRNSGIHIVDATELFKNKTETIYVDDCCHYNKKGYSYLSDVVFSLLPTH